MIQFFLAFIASITLTLSTTSFAADNKFSLPTVTGVELNSYVGLWYEIRRIENEFQDNEPTPGAGPCYNSTAQYSFLPRGIIGVKNTCYRQTGADIAIAKARVVRNSNNAKLEVNFTGNKALEWLGIGSADYWILALGPKNAENLYSWVLVGTPDLNNGWILSRTPELPESEIQTALAVAASVGYETSLFKSFRR